MVGAKLILSNFIPQNESQSDNELWWFALKEQFSKSLLSVRGPQKGKSGNQKYILGLEV